jgi:hypothetical protein
MSHRSLSEDIDLLPRRMLTNLDINKGNNTSTAQNEKSYSSLLINTNPNSPSKPNLKLGDNEENKNHSQQSDDSDGSSVNESDDSIHSLP